MTPEEIEAEAEDLDEFNFDRLKTTIEAHVGELKQTIENKCVLQ